MKELRKSILEQRFPQFIQEFMDMQYPGGNYEPWAVNALASVNVHLTKP